ncbi:Uncharacterised protein [Mycobacteroides abscessus subsp. abscessus]|nr:Uncharacterised protein [Mycobacteroides abscessus subsp. abscessus]
MVLEILEHLDHRIENEHNGIRGLVRLESGGRSELRVGRDNGRQCRQVTGFDHGVPQLQCSFDFRFERQFRAHASTLSSMLPAA